MAKSIKWRLRGFEELRRTSEVKAELARHAERIAAACGKPGYRAVTSEGRTRSRAAVVTTDAESIRDNARNQTLLRAMDSGRG